MSTSVPQFVFVVEHSLGNAIHGRNIERALSREDTFRSTMIRVEHGHTGVASRIPVLRSWSFEASTAAHRALRSHLDTSTADALYIHTQTSALRSCGLMRRVPTVVSIDATPMNYDTMGAGYGHKRQPAAVEEAKRRVTRRVFRAAAALVAFSRWAADSVVNDYDIAPERVHVIPAGVDLSRFRPGTGPRVAGPARILFVGKDFARKGGPELVQAMGRLADVAELDIVTGVPPALPDGLPIRVHTGLTHESEELFDLYRNADIFAFPSTGDCMPNAVCEAAACGLPIVCCPVGAIPEVAVAGRNALMVPSGSPEALAGTLRRLVEQVDMRLSFAQASLEIARGDFDASRNLQSVFDLLRAVSLSKSPHPIAGKARGH